MTLTLIRGIPGSSKSTFAKRNFNCLILENDMFHYKDGEYCYDSKNMKDAISWCVSMTETALEKGIDVCVANTFTKRIFVDSYRKIAEKHGAEFKVYRMMGNFNNIHDVPRFVLENMKNNFEDYPGEMFVYPNENENDYEITEERK